MNSSFRVYFPLRKKTLMHIAIDLVHFCQFPNKFSWTIQDLLATHIIVEILEDPKGQIRNKKNKKSFPPKTHQK